MSNRKTKTRTLTSFAIISDLGLLMTLVGDLQLLDPTPPVAPGRTVFTGNLPAEQAMLLQYGHLQALSLHSL